MKQINLEKVELRKKIHQLNVEFKNKNFNDEDNYIIQKILSSDIYKSSKTILIYYPLQNEVNTIPLIDRALLDGKVVALPKLFKEEMHFIKIEKEWKSSLNIGSYKVREPISNIIIPNYENDTLMIVPNLALGKDNSRLGHGKGYYDKFLQKNSNIYKIGICRKYLLFEKLPITKFDRKLDEVISK